MRDSQMDEQEAARFVQCFLDPFRFAVTGTTEPGGDPEVERPVMTRIHAWCELRRMMKRALQSDWPMGTSAGPPLSPTNAQIKSRRSNVDQFLHGVLHYAEKYKEDDPEKVFEIIEDLREAVAQENYLWERKARVTIPLKAHSETNNE